MVCLTIRTNFRYGWLQAFEVDVFGSPSGSPRACFQEIILGCPRCSGTCSSVSQVSNKWCEALSSVFLCSGGPLGSISEVLHYRWHDHQKIDIFQILGVKGTEFLNSPIYENFWHQTESRARRATRRVASRRAPLSPKNSCTTRTIDFLGWAEITHQEYVVLIRISFSD